MTSDLVEVYSSGTMTSEQLDDRLSFFSSLNERKGLYLQAAALAKTYKRVRIEHMLLGMQTRSFNLEALPDDFQPLDKEPHLDLWQPFITPDKEGQLEEWLANPKSSKRFVAASVEDMRRKIGLLEEKLGTAV